MNGLLAAATQQEPAMSSSTDFNREFGPELVLFCRRMVYSQATAEDITQDVFAALCRTAIEEIENVRSWLYRVARNRCLDVLRKMRPEERLSAIQSSGHGMRRYALIDPATTPAGQAMKAERSERILGAVDELDDDLRSIIILRFWQGLLREELAEVLGLSRSGVDHRLNRAVRSLAEQSRKWRLSQC